MPTMALRGSTLTGDKPRLFLEEIGEKLPEDVTFRRGFGSQTLRDIERILINVGWANYGVLIVDEAQNLKASCLEVLREIHDATGVGIVMVGNDHFRGRFKREEMGQYAHISSRITRRLPRIDGVLLSDVAAMARHHGVDDAKTIAELQRFAVGSGGLRHVVSVIDKARDIAGPDSSITVEMIGDAAAIMGIDE